jgi:hypothetical protein
MLETASSRVLDGMGVGDTKSLDPALILIVSQLVITVINACKNRTPKELKEAGEDPGLFERIAVRRRATEILRREFGRDIGRSDFRDLRDEMVEAVFSAGSEASEEDLAKLKGEVLKS